MPIMARMLVLASLWTTPYGVYGVVRSSFAWESLAAVAVVGVIGTGATGVQVIQEASARTSSGVTER